MTNLPDIQKSIRQSIEEYNAKCNGGDVYRQRGFGEDVVEVSYLGAEAEVAAFKAAIIVLKSNSLVAGAFAQSVFEREPMISVRDVKESLLKSAWKHIYDGLNIAAVATAKDRKLIETMMESPPAFTLENIREQFGDYLLDPRHHVLRGLAEAFTDLDPAFKSHSKVAIGVKGLPKRIIIECAVNQYSRDSWGENKLRDVVNALLVFRDKPRMEYGAFQSMKDKARINGEANWGGGRLKGYRNGNAHLHFDKDALLDVNRALAEFYGNVLPDSPEAADDLKKRTGTEVARDLQFFGSPIPVVSKMIDKMPPRASDNILEPSCGTGAIMDGVAAYVRKERINDVHMTGLEVHAGRAAQAKAKGHVVVATNFLEYPSTGSFDLIYMNPPFYGRHYLKHLHKAIEMLKPGGRLISVLPASAWYDHGDLPGRNYNPDKPYDGRNVWLDLPLAAFRESNTNICTGLWSFTKGDKNNMS